MQFIAPARGYIMRKITKAELQEMVSNDRTVYDDRQGFAVPMFGRHTPNATIIFPPEVLENVVQNFENKQFQTADAYNIVNYNTMFGYVTKSQTGKTKFYISHDPSKWTHRIHAPERGLVTIDEISPELDEADINAQRKLIADQKILNTKAALLNTKAEFYKEVEQKQNEFDQTMEQIMAQTPISFIRELDLRPRMRCRTPEHDWNFKIEVTDAEIQKGQIVQLVKDARFLMPLWDDLKHGDGVGPGDGKMTDLPYAEFLQKIEDYTTSFKNLCENHKLKDFYNTLVADLTSNMPQEIANEMLQIMNNPIYDSDRLKEKLFEAISQDPPNPETYKQHILKRFLDKQINQHFNPIIHQMIEDTPMRNCEASETQDVYVIHPDGTMDKHTPGMDPDNIIVFHRDDLVINMEKPKIQYKPLKSLSDEQEAAIKKINDIALNSPNHPSHGSHWGERTVTPTSHHYDQWWGIRLIKDAP